MKIESEKGKLNNKIVLITGGTSGIGEACALLFSKEGAIVYIVGRDEKKAKKVIEKIQSNKTNPSNAENSGGGYFICDVSSESEVIKLKEEFIKKHDKLDILVNNAGIFLTDPLEKLSSSDWIDSFSANTNSVMYMTKYFLDLIISAKGNILNNASNAGLQSNVKGRATYSYSASKAATIQFSQKCALNYSDKIRVNVLCPGVVETPLFTNQDFSRFLDSIPMGRVAKPIEIAKAALFLVSDDASYISGSVLTVDGAASIK